MEYVYEALVVLHFIGLASLLGGFLVQIRDTPKVVNRAMLDGALTQLVTGLALVGLAETALADEEDLNHAKVAAKLVVLALVLVLTWVNRHRKALPTGVWAAIGGLTVLNIVIAVFV